MLSSVTFIGGHRDTEGANGAQGPREAYIPVIAGEGQYDRFTRAQLSPMPPTTEISFNLMIAIAAMDLLKGMVQSFCFTHCKTY